MKFPCMRENVVFCTEHLARADTKFTYFKFLRLTDLELLETNLIF